MDTDKDKDMSPPDADMSTTDAPMDVPPVDMDPIIISSTETVTDYYAPEYSILAVLYFLIALLYIVNSQIDVPTTINDWLRANPDYINLSLATLYAFISIVYVTFFHLPQDTIMQSNSKVFVISSILLLLVYAWRKLLRRESNPLVSTMEPVGMAPGGI
jgi:fumarate reductase subunit C